MIFQIFRPFGTPEAVEIGGRGRSDEAERAGEADRDHIGIERFAHPDAGVEAPGAQVGERIVGYVSRGRGIIVHRASCKNLENIREFAERRVEGSWRAHQVPFDVSPKQPQHLPLLEAWLRSYRPQELFDADGALRTDIAALAPRGNRRLGANPHANGGLLLQDLELPDFRDYAVEVPHPGATDAEATRVLGVWLRDVMRANAARRDFRVRYVPTPMEAMQLLITRRVRHALLAEPAVSMALRKTQSFPVGLIAPELHRGADLQQEWGRVFQRAPRIPQAGIAAVGAVRAQPAVLAAVAEAYARSVAWCRANPLECGRMVAARMDLLTPEAVADAVATSQLDAVPAQRARAEIDFFFQQLFARDPALLGGKLPDDKFFHTP